MWPSITYSKKRDLLDHNDVIDPSINLNDLHRASLPSTEVSDSTDCLVHLSLISIFKIIYF